MAKSAFYVIGHLASAFVLCTGLNEHNIDLIIGSLLMIATLWFGYYHHE